jgi:hypothetical protein
MAPASEASKDVAWLRAERGWQEEERLRSSIPDQDDTDACAKWEVANTSNHEQLIRDTNAIFNPALRERVATFTQKLTQPCWLPAEMMLSCKTMRIVFCSLNRLLGSLY